MKKAPSKVSFTSQASGSSRVYGPGKTLEAAGVFLIGKGIFGRRQEEVPFLTRKVLPIPQEVNQEARALDPTREGYHQGLWARQEETKPRRGFQGLPWIPPQTGSQKPGP